MDKDPASRLFQAVVELDFDYITTPEEAEIVIDACLQRVRTLLHAAWTSGKVYHG